MGPSRKLLAGVVTHVHLGHGRAVYHLTDRLHHHAVCEACGAVIQLAGDVLGLNVVYA